MEKSIRHTPDDTDFRAELEDKVDKDWMVDASCRKPVTANSTEWHINDQMFFPDGKSDKYRLQRQELCFSCPVQQECEAFGNVAGREWGAWGGFTTDERRIRRRGRLVYRSQEVQSV